MSSHQGPQQQATSTNELPLLHQQFTTVNGLKLCAYTNITSTNPPSSFKKSSVLVLIHGYPQSPYEWRYLAPKFISAGYPIFIPDLPGYANSPDRTHKLPQDKLSTGTAILQSLAIYLDELSPGLSKKSQDVILITHDRGSRIGHRLSVSKPLADKLAIKAVTLMDIVPTTVQFAGMGRPEVAKGYFHWAMLQNVDIAVKLITSFGGANWVKYSIDRMTGMRGTKEASAVYAPQYDDEDVVRASARDYEAAASVDVPAQLEDQEKSIKLGVPTLVFWSEKGLGKWFDVEKEWRVYMVDGIDAEFVPVGEDAGHYLPEDAPETVSGKILKWLERVDK